MAVISSGRSVLDWHSGGSTLILIVVESIRDKRSQILA